MSGSRFMLASISGDSLSLPDTVTGTVVESFTSARSQASTFVVNDVLIGHAGVRLDPNLDWSGASTQLSPAVSLPADACDILVTSHLVLASPLWTRRRRHRVAWVAWVAWVARVARVARV